MSRRNASLKPAYLLAVAFLAGMFTRELSLPPRNRALLGYSHGDTVSPGTLDASSARQLGLNSSKLPTESSYDDISDEVVRQQQEEKDWHDQVAQGLLLNTSALNISKVPANVKDDVHIAGESTTESLDDDPGSKVRSDGYGETDEGSDESSSVLVGLGGASAGTEPDEGEDNKDHDEAEGAAAVGIQAELLPEQISKDGRGEEEGESTSPQEAGVERRSIGMEKSAAAGRRKSRGSGSLSKALGSVLSAGGLRRRTAKKWATPFVTPFRVSKTIPPVCQGIIPSSFSQELERKPIESLRDLKRPGQRVLLVSPRFGLGNALRGYVSAFVYALLSGRRLVRFHGGQHAKVFDLMCQGFFCGYDAIHWNRDLKDGPQVLWREIAKLRPFSILPHKLKTKGIIKSLNFSYPLVMVKVGSFFDFWFHRPDLRRCVYKALNCRSLWCVHSRAIYSLLGDGPTEDLEQVVHDVMERRDYSGTDVPSNPGQIRLQHLGVDVMFDVAVHVRTRTEAVEHSHTNDCEENTDCKQQFLEASQARVAKYLSPRLWGCIRKIILKRKVTALSDGGDSRKFTIFLATDNQVLRNAFADRLATMGTVYYSSGKVVHTSKVSGGLPTLAEWYLLAKANLVLEAESYISTFAYFAGLLGNSTLGSLSIKSSRRCSLKIAHDAS